MKHTLYELRKELQGRLGFQWNGKHADPQETILNSFIRDAQEFLYWEYNYPGLKIDYVYEIGKGQNRVDWGNLELRKNLAVFAQPPGQPCKWTRLKKDIPEKCREALPVNSKQHACVECGKDQARCYCPVQCVDGCISHYELREQLWLYPPADKAGWKIRIAGYKKLAPLYKDDGYLTLDYHLVFKLALAKAKAHYNQPDAQSVGAQLEHTLARIKQSAHDDFERHIDTGCCTPTGCCNA